jgi:hypothetical protein
LYSAPSHSSVSSVLALHRDCSSSQNQTFRENEGNQAQKPHNPTEQLTIVLKMMMAYNDKLYDGSLGAFGGNSFGIVDPCDPCELGKVDSYPQSADAMAAQLQPAFFQQHFSNVGLLNNSNSNCGNGTLNQSLSVAKIQPISLQPIESTSNCDSGIGMGMGNMAMVNQCTSYNNIIMNVNMNNSHRNIPMMNGMNVQQHFFPGASDFTRLAIGGASNTNQQSQQILNGIPTFVTMSRNRTSMMSEQQQDLLRPSPPRSVQTSINLDAHLDDESEPTPFCPSWEKKKTAERRTSPLESQVPRQSSSCSLNKIKRLLPPEWVPNSTSIICGNKRKYFESEGNTHFRDVCSMFTRDYAMAPNKIEKSAVVSQVMNILRQDCSDGVCFVSPQGGRWYAVSERTAREKVGTYLRDCLSGHYLSSAKNKIARRKMTKTEMSAIGTSSTSNNNHAMTPTPAPAPFSNKDDDQDDGSLGSISFYDVDDLTPIIL